MVSKEENDNMKNGAVQMGTCEEKATYARHFAIILDDETHTFILCPIEEGKSAIKLTEKTAKLLVAIIEQQIQDWL